MQRLMMIATLLLGLGASAAANAACAHQHDPHQGGNYYNWLSGGD